MPAGTLNSSTEYNDVRLHNNSSDSCDSESLSAVEVSTTVEDVAVDVFVTCSGD